MNNRQASIIAAAAFHSGQQASIRDVEQTASTLERTLSEWDATAGREELHEAWTRYDNSSPEVQQAAQDLNDASGRPWKD